VLPELPTTEIDSIKRRMGRGSAAWPAPADGGQTGEG
jgi:hypothetical protein